LVLSSLVISSSSSCCLVYLARSCSCILSVSSFMFLSYMSFSSLPPCLSVCRSSPIYFYLSSRMALSFCVSLVADSLSKLCSRSCFYSFSFSSVLVLIMVS
jgi:hypothetical protein